MDVRGYLPKQAYPAAEEARPAAVGKLFSEQIWTCQDNISSIREEDRSMAVSPGAFLLRPLRRTEINAKYRVLLS